MSAFAARPPAAPAAGARELPGRDPAGTGSVPAAGGPAGRGFRAVLEARARGAAAADARAAAAGQALPVPIPVPGHPRPSAVGAVPVAAAPPDPAAAALAVLGRIDGARARLDALLSEARRGRSFSPAELLCLQADAHRLAQAVELAARAAEHGVQGVKQAVHLQV